MSNILNIKNQFSPSMSNLKTLFSGFYMMPQKPQIHLNPIRKKGTDN